MKIAVIIILLINTSTFAISKIDSLQRLLLNSKDSSKVNVLNSLAYEYGTSDFKKSASYANSAIKEALKINFKKGEISGQLNLGYALMKQGNFDSCVSLIEKAIAEASLFSNKSLQADAYKFHGLAKWNAGDLPNALTSFEKSLAINIKIGNLKEKAKIFNHLGNIHLTQQNLVKALDYYIQAAKINEQLGEKTSLAASYNNIALVLSDKKDYEKALSYYEKSLAIKKDIGDQGAIALTIMNIGNLYFQIKNFPKSLEYLNKAFETAIILNNEILKGRIYSNLGNTYKDMDKPDLAFSNFKKALSIKTNLKDSAGIAAISGNIGFLYANEKKYDEAIRHINMSLDVAKKTGQTEYILNAYLGLSEVYKHSKQFEKANIYLNKYYAQKDSIFNEEKNKQLTEIEVKYETEKKEQAIKLLNQEKQVQALMISKERNQKNILLGSVLGIIIISGITYRNYSLKQKNKLNEELIRQEKLRLNAIVKTQEEERKRISAELHDGIGQLLASAKLNLGVVNKIELSEPKVFDNALSLIDESCTELRNIAHNIMPGILIKGGISKATEELVYKINSAGKIKIYFDSELPEKRYPETIEISIFRIIQELINNILKYAEASEIYIQISENDENFIATIEDNGKGLDKRLLSSSKGNGWNNINTRLNLIKGNLEIDSQAGKGTVILIEVPLKKN